MDTKNCCYPIHNMQFRTHGLSPVGMLFGAVRNGGTKNHQGWDLYAEEGTWIYAMSDGEVVAVHNKNTGDHGKYIILSFTYAKTEYHALYAHLSEVKVPSPVKGRPRPCVKKGQAIGQTGCTGNALDVNAPHLHLEIGNKKFTLPRTGLEDRIDPKEIFHVLYAEKMAELKKSSLNKYKSEGNFLKAAEKKASTA